MNLIDFAVLSKGIDATDKIKLILFAAGVKPNIYIVLKINSESLDEKYQFEQILKKNKIIFEASRQKGYEEIRKIEGNRIRWEFAGIWVGYDLFKSKADRKKFIRYKQMLRKQQENRAHKLAGRLYGYPECCIKSYIKETPQFIEKHYTYYQFYKRLHDSDKAFPFVFHGVCSPKCRATAKLNRIYSDAVRKYAPKFWKEYTSVKRVNSELIVDAESDILLKGKTIWPERDGHDYSLILRRPYEGKHYIFSYLSKRCYERGAVLSAQISMRCDYAEIKVRKAIDIINGLLHERKMPLIGRKY